MRPALGPGALGRPGGSGWRGRWEGGSGWGRHVNPRPFNFNVWKIHYKFKKKKKKRELFWAQVLGTRLPRLYPYLGICYLLTRGFPCGSVVTNPHAQQMQVRSLGQEDPLEKEMSTHSSLLAWEIPWIEGPGWLKSIGLPRGGHYWATEHTHTHTHTHTTRYLTFPKYKKHVLNY